MERVQHLEDVHTERAAPSGGQFTSGEVYIHWGELMTEEEDSRVKSWRPAVLFATSPCLPGTLLLMRNLEMEGFGILKELYL